jgi:hypothetical protein
MPKQKRDSRGRFDGSYWTSARDNPGTTAAVAAAGAFLWTRRAQIGEALRNGMDQLSEMKAERMASSRTQEEIAEEALTLKETAKKSRGPRGPIAQQDIKAGMATAE